jgi:hypothetical protein
MTLPEIAQAPCGIANVAHETLINEKMAVGVVVLRCARSERRLSVDSTT